MLLLEAYEQLEADVGQEVDRALAKQADELSRLARRVQFLEGHLEAERHQVALLGEEGAKLEGRLADASAKNAQYESGVYGLPQVRKESAGRSLAGLVAAVRNNNSTVPGHKGVVTRWLRMGTCMVPLAVVCLW